MAVGVAGPTSIAGHLGPQPLEHLGQARVGAAVVGHLHRVHVGQVEREQRLALGVGGEQQVEAAAADDRDHRPRVGVLGRRAGRPRRRGEHADAQAAAGERERQRRDRRRRARTPRRSAAARAARKAGSRVPSPPSSSRSTGKRRAPSARPPWWSREAWVATTSGEPATPARRSRRDDARLGRAAVEQDRRAVGVLDQGGVALADVEEADREPLGRPRAARAGAAGQHECGGRATAATSARRRRARQPRASERRRRAARGRRARRRREATPAPRASSGVGAAERRGRAEREARRWPPGTSAKRSASRRGSRRAARRPRRGPTRRRRRAPRPAGRARRRAGRAPSEHADHITGATAGSASRLAGSPASGTRAEVVGEQRRGGERGRDA